MGLRRTLGLTDVVLFFVVASSNLQWVATAAAAGPSAIPVWVIGGLAMFAPLSISVVFLASQYPEEGGLYVWSKRAFGPFAGFITGWTYWASLLPYFPALLYFAAGNALFIGGTNGGSLSASPWYYIVVALAALLFATIVNIYGLEVGKWLNNAGAVSRWTVTLLLVALGAVAWWKFGPATPIDTTTMRPGLQLKDIIFWSVIAFAWTGPEGLPLVGGEIKNPRRTIPLGLMLAAPAIAIIYIGGTAAVLAALAPQAVNPSSGVMQAIATVATRMHWSALIPVAAVLVALSCFGSAGAWLGAGARLPFVAGIDRYLPASFGRVHPRWGSPVVSLVSLAIIAAVFIFLGQAGTSVRGAYNVLVSSTVVVTLVPFLFLFAAAIKLRDEPRSPEMIRIPGGKWTVSIAALVGLLTTLSAIVFAGFPADDDPHKTLAVVKVVGLTTVTLLVGVAIYLAGRGREARG
jgi:amino acid transporter